MKYSYSNSFDLPKAAFKKGLGYCWQQAEALNTILRKLGYDSWLVYATQNKFPDKLYDGILIKVGISGHVWCRVKIDDVEKDVCAGNINNKPGIIHFEPISSTKKWNSFICVFAYIGSAVINVKRLKEFEKLKKESARRGNPDNCVCKKKSCPRYKKCEECRAYHYNRHGLPNCERGIGGCNHEK